MPFLKYVFVLEFLFLNANAFAKGGMDSGGGSSFAAEFSELGYSAARAITMLKEFPVSSAAFRETVQKTKVEFTSDLLRDSEGREVDALNFPSQNLVQVSTPKWEKIPSPVLKYQLAVHEYLGILRIDDSGYHQSRLVLEFMLVGKDLLTESKWSSDYLSNDGVPSTLIWDFTQKGVVTLTNICRFSQGPIKNQDVSVTIYGRVDLSMTTIDFLESQFKKEYTPDRRMWCGAIMRYGDSFPYSVLSKTEMMINGDIYKVSQ